MADLNSKGITAASEAAVGDDLLTILNREAQDAIHRIAEQLKLPTEPRSGPEANPKYRLISQALEARRKRVGIFDSDLFGEPAWDILLAMYRDHLVHRAMTLANAVAAADVPLSTATRWLVVLERRGLIERSQAGDHLSLTPSAVNKLETYIERLHSKPIMWVI